MKRYSIGIDIGGTKCAVVLGQAQIPEETTKGFILDRICFPTEAVKGPKFTIINIIQGVSRIIEKHQITKAEVIGIGISCGGPLDSTKGVIMNPPNLYGWDYIPIVKLIEDKFGIPTFIQNDANACAIAEWRFGAAKGYKDIIFLTFGTGMGAGLILDGKLYAGASNMAGEVGHIRFSENGPVGFGKSGSFEGFCSGEGIVQLAKIKVLEKLQIGIRPSFCPDYKSLNKLSAKSIAIAAESGDVLARQIYATSGHYLGYGLSMLIDILNPEIIVIGSIFTRNKDLIWPSAHKIIEKEALQTSRNHCRVVPARLGDQIGDFAALSVAFEGD